VGPDLLLRIYRIAVVTRCVDERLWILARQGRAGFVLTARGHEIAQIATVAAMRRGTDSAWPYYRDLGVGLALGVTPYELFLGALGRAADPHSGGRQLTAHLSDPRLRIGSVSSEVAAHIPHAVGAAYAARVRGEAAVAVCWFGDGASSEGATHEAMNLAAVHALPVVFVCENNGYAISVPVAEQMAVPMAERAAGYGIPGSALDGTDSAAVFAAAATAIGQARGGGGPTLLELRVPRMTPHSSQDDDRYRSEEELRAAAAADPVARVRRTLLDSGVLSEDSDAALVDGIRADVVADQDRALAMPPPDLSRARRWLYAGDPQHEPPRPEPTPGVFA
jgi:2-oxoisovalerate dehydrogenase E1 component alpha subunit